MTDRTLELDRLAEQVRAHEAAGAGTAALLPQIWSVADLLHRAFEAQKILYTCGNGGSAADAQHFTGELIGHYRHDRRPLPAVTLGADLATQSCIANDYAYEDVFSRQIRALVRVGDVVAAFTTSGRSPNIVNALRQGRENGATTVLFTGADSGDAGAHSDIILAAPSQHTPRIQETHTLMLHLISDLLDEWTEAGSR